MPRQLLTTATVLDQNPSWPSSPLSPNTTGASLTASSPPPVGLIHGGVEAFLQHTFSFVITATRLERHPLIMATPTPNQPKIHDHDDVEAGHRDLTFRAVDPVDIRVSNLGIVYESTPSPLTRLFPSSSKSASSSQPLSKTILHNVSAHMPAGSLTAIIGSSGSGKTTLLNTISRRVTSKTLRLSGSSTFNGNEVLSSVRSAYVMQQDVLIPSLTVRETLRYAADLRLPAPATKAERRAIVERVILELGLKECADTRIGNSAHKGCSGGEKRRTSIGVQMLANPSVLFLDEPTTGEWLDLIPVF